MSHRVLYAITATTSLTGATWSATPTLPVSSSDNSSTTFYIWAKDSANQVNSVQYTKAIGIDLKGPTINSATLTDSSTSSSTWCTNGTLASTVTAVAGGSGESPSTYAITATNSSSGATWNASPTLDVSSLSDSASTTFYIWAKDALGMVNATQYTKAIGIDLKGPTINSATLTDSSTSSSTWCTSGTLASTVTAVAGGRVRHPDHAITATTSLTGATWNASPTLDVSSLSDSASTTFYIWAKDALGMVNATQYTKAIGIDLKGPTINSATLTDSSTSSSTWCTSGTLASTVTAVAGGSGESPSTYAITATTSLTGATWNASPTLDVSSLSDSASTTFYIWAKDALGMVNATQYTKAIGINMKGPTINSATLTDSSTSSSTWCARK